MEPTLTLTSRGSIPDFIKAGGGKAANLARLTQLGLPVPDWFCLRAEALPLFLEETGIKDELTVDAKDLAGTAARIETLFLSKTMPDTIVKQVKQLLADHELENSWLAVRSSGMEEDSAEHSFAGQFSSYLFQRGIDCVLESIQRCWASGYSERALSYRLQRGLSINAIGIAVVVQKMVNATAAGVAFSRNPMRPLERDTVVISSVWGLGEGLVSGELDADHFSVQRGSLETKTHIVAKTHALRQAAEGGLVKTELLEQERSTSSLEQAQCDEVARLAISLEEKLGAPQDCEWAWEENHLYCVQTRPITTLPPSAFYDESVLGRHAILWDNSNIIESYSGVTSPLTFSFARNAYEQVYLQFCDIMGVPKSVVIANESMFRNMLGLIRGRVFYNLGNWYKLVLMLPGSATNKGFMETMMGVQQGLKPEQAAIFDFMNDPPKYSFTKKMTVLAKTVWRFWNIDRIVNTFHAHFKTVYEHARKTDFSKLSLTAQAAVYEDLNDKILRRWQAPIINDYLCMIFFGLLKKLTQKWIATDDAASSLQNDLLCGQGDLESTEPTKTLMRIAGRIDAGDSGLREWFIQTRTAEVWEQLKTEPRFAEMHTLFVDFLDRYGFRCVNELKLEEPDLNDDPAFVVGAVQSYVKMKAYSIEAIEKREQLIKSAAEAQVLEKLSGIKRVFYFWVVKQARRAVRNRENLRFARTKIFGVSRHLFRAIGENLVKLNVLKTRDDIFSLTIDEIFSYIDGRSSGVLLGDVATLRRNEFEAYKKTQPPPSRFLTTGAVGPYLNYPQVLADADLMRSEAQASSDPNVLIGTSCCPGVVEGVVRVVNELKDCQDLNGEILVTERTDPGWVPLYPSCSGLLIERGSLLSHSAVVARELGLPTIVGISGGLMTKLKTGQRVRMDAGTGEVRILS